MKVFPSLLLVFLLLAASLTTLQAQAFDISETVREVSACVEELRGLSFKQELPVKLISRAEASAKVSSSEWEGWELAQQEYEALYLVPPGVSAKKILEDFYGEAILGYYDSEKDEIVIVQEAEETLNKAVLAHELTHALLDQYYPEVFEKEYDLTDPDLALSALREGDAELVEELYLKAVEEGKYWDCDLNLQLARQYPGIIYLQLFPYFEGYNFVKALRRLGGWEAVNQAYANPPESTEQVIHPSKYPSEKPVRVEVEGPGFNGWEKLGEDVVGEATIYIMFWNQGLTGTYYSVEGRPTYRSPLSAGWAGDRMVVYKRGENEYGYVWLLAWDTEEDAEEFLEGYLEMLASMGASQVRGAWKVSPSDYVEAWRENQTVTIVNAPSLGQIDEIMMAAGLPIVEVKAFKAESLKGLEVFTFTLQNLTPEDQPATIIVQVKNLRGRVLGLSYISGSLPSWSLLTFKTSFTLKPGTYQTELYVWRSLKNPIPLASPKSLQVEAGSMVKFALP
ncbi:MAG: hypothetical protein DRO52_04140 [Candidatus Hecatellales archaeon]|nr:MAG: hypothetical protein DRO52_04140 [Candidatus Hecatellales archaeon]